MKIKAAQRSKKVVLELEPGEPGLPPAPGAQITLRRILVPVDFSESSRKAVQYAVTFANQFNAEVLLLHIFEISLPLAQPFAFETGLPGARAREEAAKQLSQWRNELLSGIRSKAVVREHTSAPHEIVTAASEN